MEVMDLICRDRRSLEYSESCVGEDSLMRLACRPVLARHVAVVSGRSAPGEAVSLIVSAHSVETVAARQFSIEMIDVGEFDIWHRALIVIAVLVEPGNGVRARATVGWRVILRDRRSARLRR